MTIELPVRFLAWLRPAFLFLTLLYALAVPVRAQTPDAFNPGADNTVWTLALQPDGKILVGGDFTTLGGQSRSRIGRLNPDGSLDTAFTVRANNLIYALTVQPDGQILAGGRRFQLVPGPSDSRCLARLSPANGLPDLRFSPNIDSFITGLTLQPDGSMVLAGWFNFIDGQIRTGLGRLQADGSLDLGFKPAEESSDYCIAPQADGKLLVAGHFTRLAGLACTNLGRLNADGSLDKTFNSPGDRFSHYPISVVAVQPDGKVLVVDDHITRLLPDGTVDPAFAPSTLWYGSVDPGDVRSLVLQANGKILVGGSFTKLNNTARTNLAMLNPDGTVDATFRPACPGEVFCLALQADGKLLVGGAFGALGGQSRIRIGRLNNSEPATQSLTLDGTTITWLRGGSSPEVWRTTFEVSADATNWTSLGAGTRIAGGWQLTGITVPPDSALRARGFLLSSGYCNGSGGIVETTRSTILVHHDRFGFRTNQFGFHFSGSPGQNVVIESSTNLLDWTALVTNQISSTPPSFADPDSANLPKRFYRARSL